MPWKFRFLLARSFRTLPCSATGPERRLLYLLERHPRRCTAAQVHAHLITTGRHRTPAEETALRLWNAILRHYSMGNFPQEALLLYRQAQHLGGAADSFTFSFLIKACANLSRPEMGRQVHCITIKKGFHPGVYVQTALLNMYCECGLIEDAGQLFDEMPEKNPVTWNALITGLARSGEIDRARATFERMNHRNLISWTCLIDGYTRACRFHEALLLFCQMMAEGLSPTEVTVLAIVPSICGVGSLDLAGSLHAFCEKVGLAIADIRVCNCLIDMYAKCGSIDRSLRAFGEISGRRNLVSWTSIISGFAMHGMAEEVMELLEGMEEEGLRPNRVTFLSILNACSHGGLVEEGVKLFSRMVSLHGVEPEIKHYGCVIDMLGRVGRLEEAEKMILQMPVAANAVLWRTLLHCCSIHGDAQTGERAMIRVLEIEKGYAGDYVTLSNTLTGAGRFGDAEGVRRLMDERNVAKIPGHSLV